MPRGAPIGSVAPSEPAVCGPARSDPASKSEGRLGRDCRRLPGVAPGRRRACMPTRAGSLPRKTGDFGMNRRSFLADSVTAAGLTTGAGAWSPQPPVAP
ncbi:twin-arginine translocation signal domain-containing protein [Kitasatospora sp. NPDC085895]|uniref:twin-arginine translocation signal domain-containing protein n=1 Tax=Kitasatospora sp. NPDC085895 TaxID=3155057 RepID=UPI003450D85A